ncbi:MAG: efflux RND transporter periplasmic adaptor subunit [Candidatus Erginobacter occultus]|nr:efflux RND transporter periplasmic adaptor subunit [Candidatus Erginobacter occultus]
MRKKKTKLFIFLAVLAVAGGTGWYFFGRGGEGPVYREISPEREDLKITISTTGVVEPQNRLEVKPPIAGRMEEIMVREGDRVEAGSILAVISSTDRASLLDAARFRDQETLRYWEEVYRPSPLIAPIAGEVIVRAVEPGQTVTANDVVLVISDRLIVKAQVDETDIGKVKEGQEAVISLDAYPETKVPSTVDHIAFESQVVSNVTIYEVDILPAAVPEVFRSGMTANVEIVREIKRNVLTLPLEAVEQSREGDFVLAAVDGNRPPRRIPVRTGITTGGRVEIVSGLASETRVLVASRQRAGSGDRAGGQNPFMPNRRR